MDFIQNSNKSLIDWLVKIILVGVILACQASYSKNLSHLSKLSDRYKTDDRNYVFGLDGFLIMTDTRGDYGKIFRKNRLGNNLYIGYSWQDITLELGYLYTFRKSKNAFIESGRDFLASTTAEPTYFSGKVKFKNTHVDLNFFSNVSEYWRAVTVVGVGFVRLGIKFSATGANGQPLATPYHDILSKTNAIVRFGFGLSKFCNENMAIRVMAYYDRYSQIRTRAPGEPHNKPFRDAYTGSVGIFFKL
jgi:hypothetical protein